jgi:hypothetical protein
MTRTTLSTKPMMVRELSGLETNRVGKPTSLQALSVFTALDLHFLVQ